MLRQRIRVERSTLVLAGQVITVLLGLALVWYGVVLGLLAVGVLDFTAANAISGYRDVHDWMAELDSDDVDGVVRAFTGVGGVLAFLLFGWLALKQLPHPQLARGELLLSHDRRGEVTVAPRAFERAAEGAALGNRAVTGAAARYGGREISVDITVARADGIARVLRDVQRRVGLALGRHELPRVQVHVTITRFDPERTRS